MLYYVPADLIPQRDDMDMMCDTEFDQEAFLREEMATQFDREEYRGASPAEWLNIKLTALRPAPLDVFKAAVERCKKGGAAP